MTFFSKTTNFFNAAVCEFSMINVIGCLVVIKKKLFMWEEIHAFKN